MTASGNPALADESFNYDIVRKFTVMTVFGELSAWQWGC